MPSPFPGVDPYLESPEFFPELHHRLITAIADAIAPAIRPKYRVAIEKRTYFSKPEESLTVAIPDVAVYSKTSVANPASSTATLLKSIQPLTVILPMEEETREGYLEIREVETGDVITAIEILSPKNKRTGKGREAYERKRNKVLLSATHLIEIDLLRRGKPMPIGGTIRGDYRILVSREERRPRADLYPFTLREEIPSFPLPLKSGDPPIQVELQKLFSEVYDRAGFDLSIDYTKSPVPLLNQEDLSWADILLREKGVR
ncbi:DUF4058 family protein [Limnofasciculus baicalensis]|uniref:DUF4058 family protein n=1 Tax=Limnofasciculus baicalensis BBK-W-15 TaxID=2699891 RepID=A0AAE3KPW0_9CYAN|nr:DUF4058 family protein [Limnofasciculus baicalensis]MCP2731940.1 DUF4058 family protein [Limnofasciculus baicalensis BBK-W-15]